MLTRFVEKEQLCIEVAPYFNPALPKAHGYNTLILDVFDTDQLRENALQDANIPNDRIDEIEEVDVVGDASRMADAIELKDVLGRVQHIVSSHNFEHLPDPVSFLQSCSKVLSPGGIVSMAIPDFRYTFDHFRMPTRLSDWLSAYHRGLRQPPAEMIFDNAANTAFYPYDKRLPDGWARVADGREGYTPRRGLKAAYREYVEKIEALGEYKDTHCSIVFGPTFELMVRDLQYLGLIDLEVVEVTDARGIEFFAYLRKPVDGNAAVQDDERFYLKRHELLNKVQNDLNARQPSLEQHLRRKSKRASLLRGLLGHGLYERARQANAKRRANRRSKKDRLHQ